MTEPAVIAAYLLSYGFIAAFLVRLVVRDHTIRDRAGDE